jgi:hypothetical protein
MTGARYEITIDGVARTWRDLCETAIDAANVLKAHNPNCKIAVRDLATGEIAEIGASGGATSAKRLS